MPKAFPKEFRHDVVAVALRREAPLSQIAKDFGISESCLNRWVKRAEIEDGVRDGLTLAEDAEIRTLKKRNRLLEQERGNTPTRVIGLKLGRTEGSVRQRASGIGQSLKPTNQSPYGTKKKKKK